MRISSKKVILFIGITYSLSWLIVFLFFGLGGEWKTPAAATVTLSYMFFPMLGAIVTQKLFKEPIQQPLGISWNFNYWILTGWLLPLPIIFMTLGLSLIFPGVKYFPQLSGYPANRLLYWGSFIFQSLVVGPTMNAFLAFGEELGWRGFLQNELIPLGYWRASWLIGVIWGIWHAPLVFYGYNYPHYPFIGIGFMVIYTVLLSPIFSYIRIRTGSVIATAILHGTINAVSGLTFVMTVGGNILTVGITGATGFIVLALVNIGFLIYDQVVSNVSIKEVLANRGKN